ncbi:hypothetical protein DIPPA_70101a, partial [Diplonema papillatum]
MSRGPLAVLLLMLIAVPVRAEECDDMDKSTCEDMGQKCTRTSDLEGFECSCIAPATGPTVEYGPTSC